MKKKLEWEWETKSEKRKWEKSMSLRRLWVNTNMIIYSYNDFSKMLDNISLYMLDNINLYGDRVKFHLSPFF